jgi:hypothetical protein
MMGTSWKASFVRPVHPRRWRLPVLPYRTRFAGLALPSGAPFTGLQFERRCPTPMRGGRAPNFYLVSSGTGSIVGIEPNLTGYFSHNRAALSPASALARTFPDHPATLLYLFWEPENPEITPIFAAHNRKIADFAHRIAGSTPQFRAAEVTAIRATSS